MKRKKILGVIAVLLFTIVAFCGIAAVIGLQHSRSRHSGGYANDPEIRIADDNGTIGRVSISTLPLEEGLALSRGSFTFSGRVLYMVRDGADSIYYTCDDDGQNTLELCRISGRGGSRLLPFADNRRVLLGDYVLECPEGSTLDNCEPGSAVLVPIFFPEAFSRDKAVTDKWTEVIIAPDNEHLAWTIRRSDCGAVNALGRLVRTGTGYEIADAKYISNMNTFTTTQDGLLAYTPVIGGEVKQFVHGGTAISLVGADLCGMADSVIQDVATGEVTQLTFTPGYDETTLLSPDEKLGITMTSRFSESSDLAVMGLVPRPYGMVLHNILGQAYMYSVTGVRGGRAGNIGPALIDLDRSMTEDDYIGLDLSDPEEEWVFNSPLSWNADGSKAMWIEREKNGGHIRLQIAELLDYVLGKPVSVVETPAVGNYAAAPQESMDYSGRINGKISGWADLEKHSGFLGKAAVSVIYHDYSDDGILFYNGSEYSSGSILSKTIYNADLHVTDAVGTEVGGMDVDMHFSAAYKLSSFISGSTSPELDLAASHGTAFWNTKTADIASLVK